LALVIVSDETLDPNWRLCSVYHVGLHFRRHGQTPVQTVYGLPGGQRGARPVESLSKSARASRTLQPDFSNLLLYGGVFVLSVVGGGLLFAHDVSTYLGNKALKVLYNDDSEGIADPDYEVAEQEWADGNFLEAIQLLRAYLKKNPREVHAALRIAEIYEKDLKNHLAAALEYEELLKNKLPPERWGWAAIHLANLYSGKLNKTDQAVAWLRRIDAEYGDTAAAEKARLRLALYDMGNAEALSEESTPEG